MRTSLMKPTSSASFEKTREVLKCARSMSGWREDVEVPSRNSNHSGSILVGAVVGGPGIEDREDCRCHAKYTAMAARLGCFYFLDEHSEGKADSGSSSGR